MGANMSEGLCNTDEVPLLDHEEEDETNFNASTSNVSSKYMKPIKW